MLGCCPVRRPTEQPGPRVPDHDSSLVERVEHLDARPRTVEEEIIGLQEENRGLQEENYGLQEENRGLRERLKMMSPAIVDLTI